MNAALEQHADHCLIRLEGELSLSCATELKRLLLEWFAGGKDLELDLEHAEEIDITIMQLLWAAARDAARAGRRTAGRASAAVCAAVRDAGFHLAPGFPFQD